MYALQKVAIKMAPRIVTHPELLVPTLIVGGIALVYDALN